MREAALVLLLVGLMVGCATRVPDPRRCELDVVAAERWVETPLGLDAGYRVRGHAGSPGTVWLAARAANGHYVSGYGVPVGPGRFEAIVELRLNTAPERFVAALEVAGSRCSAEAPPGS